MNVSLRESLKSEQAWGESVNTARAVIKGARDATAAVGDTYVPGYQSFRGAMGKNFDADESSTAYATTATVAEYADNANLAKAFIKGGIKMIVKGGANHLDDAVQLGIRNGDNVAANAAQNGAKKIGKMAPEGPSPNGGNAKSHGGSKHNDAIDTRVNELKSDGEVTNIRKNQTQVDASGKKVGSNRPDVQYDKDGQHHNVEYDNIERNSVKHRDVISRNDPNSKIETNILD